MYRSFAFCFSISSLFEGNTPVTEVSTWVWAVGDAF